MPRDAHGVHGDIGVRNYSLQAKPGEAPLQSGPRWASTAEAFIGGRDRPIEDGIGSIPKDSIDHSRGSTGFGEALVRMKIEATAKRHERGELSFLNVPSAGACEPYDELRGRRCALRYRTQARRSARCCAHSTPRGRRDTLEALKLDRRLRLGGVSQVKSAGGALRSVYRRGLFLSGTQAAAVAAKPSSPTHCQTRCVGPILRSPDARKFVVSSFPGGAEAFAVLMRPTCRRGSGSWENPGDSSWQSEARQ